jgi:hypothetical protein
MKTRLIFLVLLIVCFSCGTNNKPVSDAQKEKIKGEVKEVVHAIFKGAEEANFDMVVETWYDSPDFVYMCNGKTYNYKECMDEMKQFLNVLLNQKCTILDEKYAVLDNSTVLGTINTKWLMNYKDGHSVLQDPWAVQFTFKKIDNRWKVIYHVESGFEKIVKASETPKELNQVELMKQFLGSWNCDIAKDTTFFGKGKSYGTGIEWNFKYVTKGKTYSEAKLLWGYDKKFDIYIISQITKGMDIELWAVWFISKNKYIMLPYIDISNPEGASFKWEGEFKSPDTFMETTIVNSNPVKTNTYKRLSN